MLNSRFTVCIDHDCVALSIVFEDLFDNSFDSIKWVTAFFDIVQYLLSTAVLIVLVILRAKMTIGH